MSQVKKYNDAELIQLLKKDDNAAFTEIYNRYGEILAHFAGLKLFHLEDAHDIIHDIFVKLWEDRHTIIISSNLRAYLYSATRYRIIDKIRSYVVVEKYATMVDALDKTIGYSIDNIIETKELQLNLEVTINKLPPRTKQIFQLSRNEHRTVFEIAQMLNLSEQTVKNQLTTALKHIRESLGNTGFTLFLFWWIK